MQYHKRISLLVSNQSQRKSKGSSWRVKSPSGQRVYGETYIRLYFREHGHDSLRLPLQIPTEDDQGACGFK